MELTEDRLTVRGYAAYGVRSMTQSAAGRYRLTSSSLFREPKEATSPLDGVVTFEANDQITVDGPATPLLLLLLAHGLLE